MKIFTLLYYKLKRCSSCEKKYVVKILLYYNILKCVHLYGPKSRPWVTFQHSRFVTMWWPLHHKITNCKNIFDAKKIVHVIIISTMYLFSNLENSSLLA